jgi:hypothetical protein
LLVHEALGNEIFARHDRSLVRDLQITRIVLSRRYRCYKVKIVDPVVLRA